MFILKIRKKHFKCLGHIMKKEDLKNLILKAQRKAVNDLPDEIASMDGRAGIRIGNQKTKLTKLQRIGSCDRS